ncbi:DUF2752 domain-containing protein [Compostibacter hankyongensis]|uniref:DUF2752 domain-containing protein n=1 Tax=Compostibacter hankyongensis TaxID=1007089 RepID=A0ABP8FF42_9BACT
MQARNLSARISVLIGLAALPLLLVYFLYDPAHSALFPACPFHRLTGLDCPGCGSQRALYQLLHGHILDALGYNLMMVMALPLILYAAAVQAGNLFRRERRVIRFLYRPWFTKLVLAAVLVFWVARNLPFVPFSWLAA